MKRSPLVLSGTAAGLVAVIGYHTAIPQAAASTSSASGNTINIGGSRTTATDTETTAATRSAVGSDIEYQYGDIELKVTMTAGKITDVTVVAEDITDPHSQQIDEYALPELRSQALQAQSADIDGVSGASYTSAAYEQSLQSAIDKLKA
jgi:uncharacterized protein with FMN-binding domain